jgi:hypothetical protein
VRDEGHGGRGGEACCIGELVGYRSGMDPLTTKAISAVVTKTASSLASKLGKRLDANERLAREREDLALTWGAELKAAMPEVVARIAVMEERMEELESKLDHTFDDPQVERVFRNFTFEAAREAVDERRRMLAHAALADVLDLRLTISQKARVERVIRELDPDDVRRLSQVAARAAEGAEGAAVAMKLGTSEAEALLAARCAIHYPPRVTGVSTAFDPSMASTSFSKDEVHVTEIGRFVLRVCHTYTRATDDRA